MDQGAAIFLAADATEAGVNQASRAISLQGERAFTLLSGEKLALFNAYQKDLWRYSPEMTLALVLTSRHKLCDVLPHKRN